MKRRRPLPIGIVIALISAFFIPSSLAQGEGKGEKNPDVAPEVSIISPEDGTVISEDTLGVIVAFGPKEKGKGNVRYILLYLDGAEVARFENPANIKEGTHTFTPNIKDLETGEHILQAFAYQAEIRAGLEGKSAIVTFTIDVTPPEIDILQPAHGSTISTATPLIVIAYSDATSGIDLATLEVLIDGVDYRESFEITPTGASYQLPPERALADGEHNIQASISDLAANPASASSTFEVKTLPPPPPITEESGFIHGQVFDTSTDLPLEGVSVTVKGIEGVVLSDSEGRFAFPTPGTGEFILNIQKEGYSLVQRKASVVETRDSAVDPAYLTPLDPKTTRITPEGGVATDSTGIIEVTLPSGAVDQAIDVRATLLEKDEDLPGPLPGSYTLITGLTLEPDITLAKPATLRTRNDLGFSPGTPIPIGYWNVEAAQWEDGGMGYVTDDGAWVEYQINHFSPGWEVNLPLWARPREREAEVVKNEEKTKIDQAMDEKDPGISIRSGSLLIKHSLPSIRSLGESNSLTFSYNSTSAKPSSLIATETFLSETATPEFPATVVPVTHGYILSFEGLLKEVKFEGTSGAAKQAFFFDGKNARGEILSTGSYPYEIVLSNDYQDNFGLVSRWGEEAIVDSGVPAPALNSISTTITGRVIINNQITSPFGAGWTLDELQRLHFDPDGRILLTEGDGSATLFTPGPLAFVAGGSTDMVYVINTTTNSTVEKIPVGRWPNFIAITPDSHFTYVAHYHGLIYVIDNYTNTVVDTLEVPARYGIRGMDIAPDGKFVYVVDNSGTVSVIDTETNLVVATVKVPGWVRGIAVTPDGNFVYIGNTYGIISVIDASRNIVVDTISVSNQSLAGIAITPDGRFAYVCRFWEGLVSVIDTNSNTVVETIPVNPDNYGLRNIVISPDGEFAYIMDDFRGVYVIDTETNSVEARLNFYGSLDLAITPNGRYLYVSTPNAINVISTDTNTIVTTIPVDRCEWCSGRIAITPGANIFTPGPGDFSRLILNSNGTYVRFMKDGTKINFNAQGLHTSTVDRNGNTTTYTYDEEGRLITITDPPGQLTEFNYDPSGYLSSITDPAGRTTSFEIDAWGDLVEIANPDGSASSFTYDDDHLLVSETDLRGFTTEYQYGPEGRVTKLIFPTEEVREFNPSETQGLINNIPEGQGTPEDPAPVVRPEDTTATITDSKGFTTNYLTNRFGAPIEQTDPLGRITRIERDEDSNPTLITRANGNRITMTYDRRGNLLTSTEESIDATTTFTYEPNFNQVTSITDPEGNKTEITYDDRGNPTQIKDALGNITQMSYDERGLLTSITDALDNQTTFTYDEKGNLLTTTDPLGNTTLLTYDTAGNVIESRDALGRITQFEYDQMNRLTSVIDAQGNLTWYEYDRAGNLIRITDANLNQTTFEYNPVNQLIKVTNPLGLTKTFTYDLNRNLVSTTNAKGQTINFTYDAANQLIKKALPDDVVDFTYDSVGNLTSVVDNDSGLTMSYDLAGRLVWVETHPTIAQPQHGIQYFYDKNGNRTGMMESPEIILPGTTLYTYTYDALNRLISLTTSKDQTDEFQTTTFNYDALSRRTNMTLPNGVTTSYSYDAASQLLFLSITHSPLPITYSYTYDPIGNRTTMTEPDGINNYTYDSLNRLTYATHPSIPTESFSYDGAGNRLTSAQYFNWTYDDANRLRSYDGTSFDYDNNGNTISKTDDSGTTTYTYNAENQLTRINFSDGTYAAYHYDGLGRRIEKDINGTITRYIYDNEDILLEYDSAGSLTAHYTHGPGIDEPLIMERDANNDGTLESHYYHTDGLGSTTQLTDVNGIVVQSYTYDSFGQIVVQVGSLVNPYAYTAREYDSESGLYYYRARYYDPKIGRFLQEDPVRLFGGINLYSYVNNNPINNIDPYGLARNPIIRWKVEREVKKFLEENAPPNAPNLPEKNRKESIEEIAREVADKISDKDAIDFGRGVNRKQIMEDLLEELKREHPDWPWQQWEDMFGKMLENEEKKGK